MDLTKSFGPTIEQKPQPTAKPKKTPGKNAQAPAAPTTGKSSSDDFHKLTVYVRHDTKTAAGIKLLQEGKRRDLSDVIELLLDGWTAGRLDV